jgi:hypothetical protein
MALHTNTARNFKPNTWPFTLTPLEKTTPALPGAKCIATDHCVYKNALVFSVYTWDKHTTVIEEKVQDLAETDFNHASMQLKQLKRTVGEVAADLTDQELGETVVDVGASFDCSLKGVRRYENPTLS